MAAKHYKLKIELINSAFEGDPAAEVVYLLREAIQRIEAGGLPKSHLLRDINGNTVGLHGTATGIR